MKENNDKIIEGLLLEREELLKAFPKLRKFQDQIEDELDHAGRGPLERAAKVNQLLVDKMATDLLPAVATLNKIKNKLEMYQQEMVIEEDYKRAA
jgi:hypothetical protein